MIWMLFTAPLFLLASGIISLIPIGQFALSGGLTEVFSMLSVAFQFFPVDVWIAVFSSIVFWTTLHLLYGAVNFVLHLIPLVSMGQ